MSSRAAEEASSHRSLSCGRVTGSENVRSARSSGRYTAWRPPQRMMASGERPGSLPVPAQASAPRWRCRPCRCRTSTQSRTSERPAKARILFTATSQKFNRQPRSGSGSTGKKRNALSKTHSILVCFPPRRTRARQKVSCRRPASTTSKPVVLVWRCRDRRSGQGFRWCRETRPRPWKCAGKRGSDSGQSPRPRSCRDSDSRRATAALPARIPLMA